VQKGDPLSLSPDPRLLIDELNARRSAARQHRIQIVDREADVMDARSALFHEARDWRCRVVGLQELHQRLSRAEPHYARPVSIVESDLGQPQYVPEERKARGEGLYRDSNVGYSSATRG